MVQITLAGQFNADVSPCQSTWVSLNAGTTANIFESINKAVDGDVGGAADAWTDGYAIEVTMQMKKAAICFQAKAGDEDGRLLAGGVSARWIRGDAFNPEGNAQDLPEVQGTIGASENWSSAPTAAWRGAKQDDGTYNEGNDVLDALNKGMKVSGKWYQPSASKSYINAPRYS